MNQGKRQFQAHGWSGLGVTLIGAVVLISLTACAPGPASFGHSSRHSSDAGTLGARARQLGVSFMSPGVSWEATGDKNGQVGFPFSLGGPRAGCSSTWNADVGIASGTLPPGLRLAGDDSISGVPTERGHWIVTFRIKDLTCNGRHYAISGAPDLLVQDQKWQGMDECKEYGQGYCALYTVRFHITGSGKVVD